MDRRQFLGVASASAGAAAIGGSGLFGRRTAGATDAEVRETPWRFGRLADDRILRVGERPFPRLAEGTDMLPQVDHVVMVMMENHSFDNMLGTLGKGDGFTIGSNGTPTNTNPDGKGGTLRAFHMRTPCQSDSGPSQDWDASHIQFANGTNEGFVISPSGPVAMAYWDEKDMPFTASLAKTFPLADRWFCSVLAQTNPNRRYLLGGTSLGLVNDDLPTELPKNGTIIQQLHRHGITWRNYYSNLPSVGVWYGLVSKPWVTSNFVGISQFYEDCAKGSLPSFSMVDPNFSTSSEENPQDIQFGEVFLASIVNAVMKSPRWHRTLLIWNYDEHGGYYDHVPPPRAPIPDHVQPILQPGDTPGKFDRFGFRVPAGVVSPYARPNFTSHTVYDHTSLLKLLHYKFNLPSLTRRDAAANDLRDMLDFDAKPAFATPPELAHPARPARRDSCLQTGPGPIPPHS